MLVVVADVVAQHHLEVTATSNEQVVEALPADAAYPAFRERVGHRGSGRRAHDFGANGSPHVIPLNRPIVMRLESNETASIGFG
jgi:hypothetical protein